MMSRQIQFTGYSTGADIVLLCNQVIVFEGTISSTGSIDQVEALVQWEQEVDSMQASSASLQIECRCVSGSLHCVDVLVNEFSNRVLKNNLSWPRAQPTLGELMQDLRLMGDNELLDKYALSNQQLQNCFEFSETLVPTGNFVQGYSLYDDSCPMVKIDGVEQTPTRTGQEQGPWHWFLTSGQNLSFDLVVQY